MRLFHVLVVVTSGFLLQICPAAVPGEQRIYEPDEGVEVMDGFGAAIAMDGEWAVVGAPRDDNATLVDQGAAYVLKRIAGTWAVQTKLRPEIVSLGYLRFGYHVAMLGDMMTISARGGHSNSSGWVFLYRRTGDVWSLEKTFAETGGNESFGASVTLKPDSITIGMPRLGGKVICHNRVGGVWQRGQVILPPSSLPIGNQGSFGESQAVEGDVLLIGCPGSENNTTFLGRVFEFRLSSGVWTQTREIQPASPVVGNRFGVSVKMVGGRALVGATGRSIVGNVFGLGAYLYQVAPSGWTLLWSATSSASVSVQSPEALALSDTRILMTAGRNVRQVRIPAMPGGSWVASTVSGTAVPVSQAMTAVAVSGDQALAGWQGRVVLDYPPDQSSADDEGQIWPLAGFPVPTVAAAVKPSPTKAQVSSQFGQIAAMEGDLAVVGAPGYRAFGGQEVGCAYILERQAGVWQIVRILDNPVQHLTSGFGRRVALSGSRVFVCDPIAGRVFGYERQNDGWPAVPTFTIVPPPIPEFSENDAVEMAASGDLLAVTEDSQATQTNYVRIYRLSGGQATPTGQVIERSANYSDTPNTFGLSLALKGNRLAITDNARITSPKVIRGEVSIYDLSGEQTRLVSALASPASPVVHTYLDSFARQVLLSENLAVTHQPVQVGREWPMAFHNTSTGYKPTVTQSRPLDENGVPAGSHSMALHGDQLFVSAHHFQGYLSQYSRTMGLLYVWRDQKWIFLREITPEYQNSGSAAAVQALSADTVLHSIPAADGARRSLSFMSTQQVVAFDGPPLEPLTVKDGQLMNLGMLTAGVRITLPVRIQNQGGTPLSLSQIHLPPSSFDTGIVGVGFTPGVVPPGADSIIQFTLEPEDEGNYQQEVEVRGPGDEVVLRFSLYYFAQSSYTPHEVYLPSSALFRAGEPLAVYSEVQVTRDATFRWLRDGRVIAGQTGQILYFPAADKTHAGHYRLEVTQPDGSRASAEMDIGVYEHVAQEIWPRENQALSLTAKVWGPGIKVRWSMNDTWAVSGSQTPTLSILRVDQALMFTPQTSIQATVSLGEVSAVCFYTLVTPRSPPVIYSDLPRRLAVGQPAAFGVADYGISGLVATYTMSGLPPGLVFDGESIGGSPTKPGTYRVVISGKNNAAEATPLVREVTVVPAGTPAGPDYGPPQSFATLLTIPLPQTSQEPATSPGFITLRTTAGTGFSGTLRAGTATRGFSGKWVPVEDSNDRMAEITLSSFFGYRKVIVLLNQVPSNDNEPVASTVSLALANDPDFLDGQFTNAETLSPYLVPNDSQRAALRGRFNVLSRSTTLSMNIPRGHAISSIQVSASMQGQMVGTLPDGTSLTSSTPLVDIGGGITLITYSADARNTLSGFLNHSSSLEAPDFPGHWFGDLYWSKKAAPGSRLYPQAINQLQLETKGTRYFVPKGRPLLVGPAYTGGRIDLNSGDAIGALTQLIAATVRFTTGHSVVFDTPNPLQHKMSVYAPTGFFTGSFVLDDPVPGSETKRQKRIVNYRGLITHRFGNDVTAGGGFFLLPSPIDPTASPPVTSSNSPIHSAAIFLSSPP